MYDVKQQSKGYDHVLFFDPLLNAALIQLSPNTPESDIFVDW